MEYVYFVNPSDLDSRTSLLSGRALTGVLADRVAQERGLMARHSQVIRGSLRMPRETARLSGAHTEFGRVEAQGQKLTEQRPIGVHVSSPE